MFAVEINCDGYFFFDNAPNNPGTAVITIYYTFVRVRQFKPANNDRRFTITTRFSAQYSLPKMPLTSTKAIVSWDTWL